MRCCIFVDGENFRRSIVNLYREQGFEQDEYLPQKADWGRVFESVKEDVVANTSLPPHDLLRTYWYVIDKLKCGVRGPRGTPEQYRETLARYKEERTKKENRFNGWQVIQNGIVHKYPRIEFRRSGTLFYDLKDKKFGAEKTVDVNLAVDMLTFKDNYDTAIILSGDQDFVPAVQAIKNMGKQVINVAFCKRNGDLLPGGAHQLNLITDWHIEIGWREFGERLQILEKP